MGNIPLTVLLLISAFWGSAKAINCDAGWSPYEDQICIRLFSEQFTTYQEALDFCKSQADSTYNPSLLLVKDMYFQDFISAAMFEGMEVVDSYWLGGVRDGNQSSFVWEDESEFSYTNWATGYPREFNELPQCVEIRPPNYRINEAAKWADVPCNKRNGVACQKQPMWSLDEVVKELVELRKKVIPIGFIYVEYPGQPHPRTLWPTLQWTDVSEAFANMFFRVIGDKSEAWGKSQQECNPRVSELRINGPSPDHTNLIPGQWNSVRTGDWSSGMEHSRTATSFFTMQCEVRPYNTAVRVWKRTA